MIRLTHVSGRPVAINPAHIVHVYPDDLPRPPQPVAAEGEPQAPEPPATTRIATRSDTLHVAEDFETVCSAIGDASTDTAIRELAALAKSISAPPPPMPFPTLSPLGLTEPTPPTRGRRSRKKKTR